jgi:hypothetical protein
VGGAVEIPHLKTFSKKIIKKFKMLKVLKLLKCLNIKNLKTINELSKQFTQQTFKKITYIGITYPS